MKPNHVVRKPAKTDRTRLYKLASIPILLCVLGFILWSNFSGSSPSATTAKDQPEATGTNNVESATNKATPTMRSRTDSAVANTDQRRVKTAKKAWPEPTLDFLNGPNPLANYRASPTESSDRLISAEDRQLESVSERRARLEKIAQEIADSPPIFSFQSGDQRTILLGDRLLKVGDHIEADVQIAAIEGGKLILRVPSDKQQNQAIH